jgi:hypothetical protein
MTFNEPPSLSPPAPPASRLLKARSAPGVIARIRSLLRGASPRAQVVAPPKVHLGERLAVEWRSTTPGALSPTSR